MPLRNIGIFLAMIGFFGGQLLSTLMTRQVYAVSQLPGAANIDPAQLAHAVTQSLNYTLAGSIVSLVGAALFAVGSIKPPPKK